MIICREGDGSESCAPRVPPTPATLLRGQRRSERWCCLTPIVVSRSSPKMIGRKPSFRLAGHALPTMVQISSMSARLEA
jgi:hypothetical protein